MPSREGFLLSHWLKPLHITDLLVEAKGPSTSLLVATMLVMLNFGCLLARRAVTLFHGVGTSGSSLCICKWCEVHKTERYHLLPVCSAYIALDFHCSFVIAVALPGKGTSKHRHHLTSITVSSASTVSYSVSAKNKNTYVIKSTFCVRAHF